jgi:Cu/Ag efflux protein CusF
MSYKRVLVAAGWLIAGVAVAGAQSVTKMGETVKATATIQEIDSTARLITFKSDDGTEDTVWAGPEVKRFDELKVGDKVNMTYYESTVYRIRKPGDPPLPMSSSGTTMTPGSGALPGGTMARQTVRTVTVKEVDPTAGTITVTTADGHVVSRKVEDKSNLAGVKVGDQIDIVYTEAILASIEREK